MVNASWLLALITVCCVVCVSSALRIYLLARQVKAHQARQAHFYANQRAEAEARQAADLRRIESGAAVLPPPPVTPPVPFNVAVVVQQPDGEADYAVERQVPQATAEEAVKAAARVPERSTQ